MFALHAICYIALPALYVRFCSSESYSELFKSLVAHGKRRYAALAFVVFAVGGFALYLLMSSILHSMMNTDRTVESARDIGLRANGGTIVLGVYFTIVNAGLEELFWRVFLHRELADLSCGAVCCAAPRAPTTWVNEDTSTLAERPAHTNLDSEDTSTLDERRQKMLNGEHPKMLVSTYYALYHVVIFLFFVPWYLAIFATGSLVIFGRLMVYVRENDRFGLVTAFGFHAGLDACCCLVLLQMYSGFMPRLVR